MHIMTRIKQVINSSGTPKLEIHDLFPKNIQQIDSSMGSFFDKEVKKDTHKPNINSGNTYGKMRDYYLNNLSHQSLDGHIYLYDPISNNIPLTNISVSLDFRKHIATLCKQSPLTRFINPKIQRLGSLPASSALKYIFNDLRYSRHRFCNLEIVGFSERGNTCNYHKDEIYMSPDTFAYHIVTIEDTRAKTQLDRYIEILLVSLHIGSDVMEGYTPFFASELRYCAKTYGIEPLFYPKVNIGLRGKDGQYHYWEVGKSLYTVSDWRKTELPIDQFLIPSLDDIIAIDVGTHF